MVLSKWNYKKKDYEPYEIPDSWQVTNVPYSYSCDCPHCGQELLTENAYTSTEIHDDFGFGYFVCRPCYEEEQERRRTAESR